MSHYIGIALNDDYTNICINDETHLKTVPTVVCKEKQGDNWYIGEGAYKQTLDGTGVMVDKLLSLLKKKGTATIDGVCYTAQELLTVFFRKLFEQDGMEHPDTVVLSIRKPERELMQQLQSVLQEILGEDCRLKLISHTESFVHFVLAQDRNLYNHQVGMFELSNQCLYYYEMKVSRGSRKLVLADSQAQEEAFNLDILKTPSGGKIADKILSALAERLLEKKTFSSVFLSGKGFETLDYNSEFMAYICKRRRVCAEPQMFAIGAAFEAGILCGAREEEEYTVICDTKVRSDIGIKVMLHEREMVLPIVQAGDGWFESRGSVEAILDEQDYVELVVSPVDQVKRTYFKITLDGFPERENRTTRIRLTSCFTEAGKLKLQIRDQGFGSLFPASKAEICEEIEL